jgi:hypothetical protein
MNAEKSSRPRYAPAVAAAAIVLAIAGVASAYREEEPGGNGIKNGSISLKEIDVPIYGEAISDFGPVDGTGEFARIYERALPRERIHGHLTASAEILLSNTGEAPATGDVRWIFDDAVRSTRGLPLEAGATQQATYLMAARLSGRDAHTLALEVAGPGVRFEIGSLTFQGLPGPPKEED